MSGALAMRFRRGVRARPAGPASALALVLAGAAAAGSGCSRDGSTGPSTSSLPDVVLVSIDSLRADRVGAYGGPAGASPAFDRIAAEGALFERASSNSSWTLPTHATMLTGLFDRTHRVRDLHDRLDPARATLAEILRRRGYRTAAVVSGPPLHRVFGLAAGFDVYEDVTPYEPIPPERRAILDRLRASAGDDPERLAKVREAHEAAISESNPGINAAVTSPAVWEKAEPLLRDPSGPLFLFLHFYDVHYDYDPPRALADRFDPDYAGTTDFSNLPRWEAKPDFDARDRRRLEALYAGEILWVDGHLARVAEALDRRARPAGAILVVTSDHGEEFLEHGGILHSKTLFEEVLRIPLAVRAPGRVAPGTRVRSCARLVDLLPTILDLAGFPPLAEAEGRSLAPVLRGSAPDDPDPASGPAALAELDHGGRRFAAIRRGRWKVIRDLAAGNASFYDLAEDPGEAHPSPAAEDPRGAALLEELAESIEREDRHGASLPWEAVDPVQLTEEQMDALDSLGYTEGGHRPK